MVIILVIQKLGVTVSPNWNHMCMYSSIVLENVELFTKYSENFIQYYSESQHIYFKIYIQIIYYSYLNTWTDKEGFRAWLSGKQVK